MTGDGADSGQRCDAPTNPPDPVGAPSPDQLIGVTLLP